MIQARYFRVTGTGIIRRCSLSGDTVIYREEPRVNVINGGNLFVPIDSFNRTTNNFQFTTGIQYRF